MTALSPTAARMLESLPAYYWTEPIVARILQAWADEIDRIDGLLDTLKDGLVPALATDALGMLAIWEHIMGLPVAPAGATVTQRLSSLQMAFLKLDASTAQTVLELLSVQGTGFSIRRDTPGALQDTLTLQYAEGSYLAGIVETAARRLWPAHRELLVSFAGGFTLDLSRMDLDEMT